MAVGRSSRAAFLLFCAGCRAHPPEHQEPAQPPTGLATDSAHQGPDTGAGALPETSESSTSPITNSLPLSGSATLSGTIRDLEDLPVAGIEITCCGPFCLQTHSDQSGDFSFSDLPATTWALHLQDPAGSNGWAEQLVAVTISEDEEQVLERPFVMVPLGPERTSSSPVDEVEIVDGLSIRVDTTRLALPDGGESGVFAGVATQHHPPALPAAEALAVWFLAPMGGLSSVDMDVEIDNQWDLAPGTSLQLYEAADEPAGWLPAGEPQVSTDGTRLVGGALTRLTTLVLVHASSDTVPQIE